MSKQKKQGGANVPQGEELDVVRATFVCMVAILISGGPNAMYDFLHGKSPEEIMEYAKVWDQCQHHPIGAVLQRPAFERYMINQ